MNICKSIIILLSFVSLGDSVDAQQLSIFATGWIAAPFTCSALRGDGIVVLNPWDHFIW
jgi:hypothetical protein